MKEGSKRTYARFSDKHAWHILGNYFSTPTCTQAMTLRHKLNYHHNMVFHQSDVRTRIFKAPPGRICKRCASVLGHFEQAEEDRP